MNIEELPDQPDGIRFYTTQCITALIVMVVAMLGRGLAEWSLFPTAVGGVALLARWRAGPVLVLFAMVWLVLSDQLGTSPWALIQGMALVIGKLFIGGNVGRDYYGVSSWPKLKDANPLFDVLLCAATLAYVSGMFRLLGLTRNVFPVERRRRVKTQPTRSGKDQLLLEPQPEQRRSAFLPAATEGATLLIVAVVCAVAGEVFWLWLSDRERTGDLGAFLGRHYLPLADNLARLVITIWLVGIVVLVIMSIPAYFGHRRLTEDEAKVFLQDQLWRQTRREQSRLNRWLAWAVERWKRRKKT